MKFHSSAFLLAFAVISSAPAAVITDPALLSGPSANLIDPLAEAEDIDGAGINATPQSVIEARSDVFSLQSVTGFTSLPTGGGPSVTNHVNFTSTTLPDISFSATASDNLQAGSGVSAAQVLKTSQASATDTVFAARHSLAGTMVITIAFGTYDTGTSSFAPNLGVSALAFSLTNLRTSSSILVQFLGMDGTTVLSTQTQASGVAETGSDGSGSRGTDYYFGYEGGTTSSTAIGSVKITRTTTSDTAAGSSIGIDDIVFTNAVVPEPTSALLLLGAGVLGCIRRRR